MFGPEAEKIEQEVAELAKSLGITKMQLVSTQGRGFGVEVIKQMKEFQRRYNKIMKNFNSNGEK